MKKFFCLFYLLALQATHSHARFRQVLEEIFTDALEQAYKNVEEKIQKGELAELDIGKTKEFSHAELEELAEKVAEILRQKNFEHYAEKKELYADEYHHKVISPQEVVYETGLPERLQNAQNQ